MEFQPQKLDLGTPVPALEYLQNKQGSDFRMNEHVQVHTGVNKLEQESDDERVERRALEKLAEIQEGAYQEAYQLGLDEGRQKAFGDVSEMIKQKMSDLEILLKSIDHMKSELLAHNESHIVRLLYHMANRLAAATLEQDDNAVLEVLKSAVSLAQAEEEVRVQMNPDQIEFIEELRKQTGREFEFMKKIRFESNAEIRRGGCVVETNYGEIDARVETRVQKLWESLADAIPKVKSKIVGTNEHG